MTVWTHATASGWSLRADGGAGGRIKSRNCFRRVASYTGYMFQRVDHQSPLSKPLILGIKSIDDEFVKKSRVIVEFNSVHLPTVMVLPKHWMEGEAPANSANLQRNLGRQTLNP